MNIKTQVIALCTLCLTVLPILSAHANEAPAARTIAVSGTGTLEAKPDLASVSIGITTSRPSADEARQENAHTASRIQTALRALGIAAADIQTSRYTFYPVYNTDVSNSTAPKSKKIVAYTATNIVDVTVKDLEKIGPVIDQSLAAGANTIHSIQFNLQNSQSAKETALKKAVNDARSKAETIAKALNKKIINILTVKDDGAYVETQQYARQALMKTAGDTDFASIPIESGNIQVNASVTIVFEME